MCVGGGRTEGYKIILLKAVSDYWCCTTGLLSAPSKAACRPPLEGGSGMSGYSKVKGAVQDVGSRGSLGCLQKIPQERRLT